MMMMTLKVVVMVVMRVVLVIMVLMMVKIVMMVMAMEKAMQCRLCHLRTGMDPFSQYPLHNGPVPAQSVPAQAPC